MVERPFDTEEWAREQWIERLRNSRAPTDVTKCYFLMMQRVYDTLTKLTAAEGCDRVTEQLGMIEEYDSQIREYMYEEFATTLGQFDPRRGMISFDSLPPGLRLIPNEHGFIIVNIPVWMLGHGGKKKLHPLYHRGRPFVRKRQLWHWLLHELRVDYLRRVPTPGDNLLPQRPPPFARMSVVFRSQFEYDIRDLDHYMGPLEVVVNSMISNALIQSDRPGRFSYAVEWEPGSETSVELRVEWSEQLFSPWGAPSVSQETVGVTGDEISLKRTMPSDSDDYDGSVCRYCKGNLKLREDETRWFCPTCGFEKKRARLD